MKSLHSPTPSASISMSPLSEGSGRSAVLNCSLCHNDLNHCKFVEVAEKNLCISCFEMQFSKKCQACKKLIRLKQKEVNYRDSYWHDACFNCVLCSCNLIGCKFAFSHSELICIACHSKERNLRCCTCEGSFQSGQAMFELEDKQWHEGCFKCAKCDFSIGTGPFVLGSSRSSLLCSDCFDKDHSETCSKCRSVIKGRGLSYRQEHWHMECFSCTSCKRLLHTQAGGDFVSKAGKLYCADCYVDKCFFVCARCLLPIGNEKTKFVNFDNENWHYKCFSCHRCSTGLTDKGFVVDKERIFCPKCATSMP